MKRLGSFRLARCELDQSLIDQLQVVVKGLGVITTICQIDRVSNLDPLSSQACQGLLGMHPARMPFSSTSCVDPLADFTRSFASLGTVSTACFSRSFLSGTVALVDLASGHIPHLIFNSSTRSSLHGAGTKTSEGVKVSAPS